MLNTYAVNDNRNVDVFAIQLRRMGYTAYVEQSGKTVLLITDYTIRGLGFTWLGIHKSQSRDTTRWHIL